MALYHSSKGPVDYTVVGSPTIVDGIASGFSGNNYLRLNGIWSPGLNPWSIQIRFNPGNTSTAYASILALPGVRLWVRGGVGAVRADIITQNGTINFSSGKTINSFSTYKLSYDGNNTYYWEKNGVLQNQSEGSPVDTSSSNWYDYIIRPNPEGSIDLNNTYIKVNGQPWFGVCPVEVKKHQLRSPVGYTVVGNPTIVDGVMTYSNVENFVKTEKNFLSSYNDYEIVCKCAKRLSTEEIIYCMSTGNNGNLQARLLSNAFRFIPHTFSNYIEIKGTFATDVWYWFKVHRTGNTIYASYSTDGVSWSNEVSKTFAQLTTNSNWISFGARITTDRDWDGTSIDLNETYIKVDSKGWFYQPADTKYIVKDGKLVWADPRIYLENDGSANYIDTGLLLSSESKIEIECSLSSTALTASHGWRLAGTDFVEGSFFGTGTGTRLQLVGLSYGATSFMSTGSTKQITDTNKHTITINQNKAYLDGNLAQTLNTSTFQCTGNNTAWLFVRRATAPTDYWNGKIYSCKFYDNNVLIGHFVPVPAGLKIGNLTVPSNGMFDIVNQQFYANQGTGEFTIGRDE